MVTWSVGRHGGAKGDVLAESRAITQMFGVAASKVLAQSLLTRPSICTT
jgi:hypothetical protein